MKQVLKGYLDAIVFTSESDLSEDSSFADETIQRAKEDIFDFLGYLEEMKIDISDLSDEQIGIDFWLTRNGHGAGFWDRGLGKRGDDLSKAAKTFGGIDVYEGDDGLIYFF